MTNLTKLPLALTTKIQHHHQLPVKTHTSNDHHSLPVITITQLHSPPTPTTICTTHYYHAPEAPPITTIHRLSPLPVAPQPPTTWTTQHHSSKLPTTTHHHTQPPITTTTTTTDHDCPLPVTSSNTVTYHKHHHHHNSPQQITTTHPCTHSYITPTEKEKNYTVYNIPLLFL